MGRALRRITTWLVVPSILLAAGGSAAAATDDTTRAAATMAYVGAHQLTNGSFPGFSSIGSTADAVLDMAATGYDRIPEALAYLRRQVRKGNVTGVGLTAKVLMAAEAAGADPTVFGGVDLIARITDAEKPSGRFVGASVFDQALAILALDSASVAPTAAEATWLADAQCPDGGWQFDRPYHTGENVHCRDRNDPSDFFSSDTNTTAYVIMALWRLATPSVDPFGFLAAIRDDRYHGWGYTWGFRRTDANSTALVIQSYRATAIAVPVGAKRALRRLQYACGAVAFSFTANGGRSGKDIGASIGAVLGFLREPFPVTPVTPAPPWATACRPD